MKPWIPEKLKAYGASIFATIGQKALEQKDCVNLGQGFPDFDCPERLKAEANKAIQDGKNQYAPLPGIPELTSAISDRYRQSRNLVYDPKSEITITNGATGAMYAALTGLLAPGDEVIVFSPVYDTYIPIAQLSGARVVEVPLEAPSFRFDPDRLSAAFSDKTRAIIVNTPHNPTGTVFNRAELELIRDLCVAHDCIAITDEVYEYLVFDGHEHISLATLEGMRERTVTISSAAKTFSITGWKIGWAAAPPQATKAIRQIHQFAAFAISTPFQHAVAAGIRAHEELVPPLTEALLIQRDRLCTGLEQTGMKPRIPEGTFFVIADYSQLSRRRDVDYVLDLIESNASIATIPLSVFYPNQDAATFNYIRFCFAKKPASIDRGLERLRMLIG